MTGIIDVLTSFGIDRTGGSELTVDDLLATMEKHGVERALTLSLRGVHYAGPEGNDETRDVCAQHEALEPVGTVDPRRYFDCFEEIQRRVDEGFRVFRFFPDLQGWSVEGLNFLRLCEKLAELQCRIMIPAGPAGQPTALAERLADLNLPTLLVGAGYSIMGEVMAVLQTHPNIYTEAHVMDTPGALELLMSAGPGRVVFGSNSPERYFESPLLMARYADISDESRADYLHNNALRFLGEEI
ncbi:MAG: amidohydrolase family protein [Armatimonadetes bacterium]|nr:amidohydrolase family protein [Armatimonadota bacterium]